MRPSKHLILVSCPEQAEEDRRLLRLALFMGVLTTTIMVEDVAGLMQRLTSKFQPGTFCLAMSADTLTAMSKLSIEGADLHSAISQCTKELLVFGCDGSKEQSSALSQLTAGEISGIRVLDQAERFALPQDAKSLSRQLAGQNFSVRQESQISVFELRCAAPSVEIIMMANERPIYVRVKREACPIFVLAAELADVDKPLSRNHGLENHYAALASLLIFLRHCFGESCWHAPESTARLIIDDPVLSDRYGFLDFQTLMHSMQRRQYGTSIAFIPWNYWRTSRQDASRLLGETSNLAICIHGCDHTNREFEAANHLDSKAALAMRRMESQQERTGAAFDKVMVFPQGLFSRAAIPALRGNNYLAAVNTTCFPTDNNPDDLKISDFLRPAITQYSGFPLFQRHYPRRLFDFAFAIFLGKPALVVEHHEYFRKGCVELEEFVSELYKMEPALSWPSLTAQLTRSCLHRTCPNGSVEVQFFTRRFQLVNSGSIANHFLLRKHEPDTTTIQSVVVDGVSVPFSFDEGFLKLEVLADSGQVRTIELVDQERAPQHASAFGVVHNAGVLMRRGLSEFRDNTLARHSELLKAAKRIARVLKVTGDARKNLS
jgi:hypothetical protein